MSSPHNDRKRYLEGVNEEEQTPPPPVSQRNCLSTARKRRRIKPIPVYYPRRPNRNASVSLQILRRRYGRKVLGLGALSTKLSRMRVSDLSTFTTSFVWRGRAPVFSARFGNVSDALAWADEDGYLCVKRNDNTKRESDSGQGAEIEIEAHSNAVFDLVWSKDDGLIFTGSGDQTCSMFDSKTGTRIRTFAGHNGSVKSVALRHTSLTFATGARDGHVFLWDARSSDSTPLERLKNVRFCVCVCV